MLVDTQLLVTLATPASVLILAYQLWQRKRQFTTEFEDRLTDQYRDVVLEIPVESLLDDNSRDDYAGDLKHYYRYVDLTNEQIFLRQEGRVSKSTWENWKAGIESNLNKSDFENAWEEISRRASDSFNEMRKFQDEDFHDDPRYWDHPIRARMEDSWYRLWNPMR